MKLVAPRQVIPFPVDHPPPDPGALAVDVWCLWNSAAAEDSVRADRLPWIPVGLCGPLLVLGHSNPRLAAPPAVPEGLFQPVLLGPSDYDRLLKRLEERLARRSPPQEQEHDPEPPVAPHPSEASRRLHAWAQVLRAPRLLRRQVLEVARQGGDAMRTAPALRGLLWFDGGGSVVPDTVGGVAIDGLPAEVGSAVRVVARRDRRLWVAARELPAHELEDLLLAHLPEDTQLHWLWLAPQEGLAESQPGEPEPAPLRVGDADPDETVTLILDDPRMEVLDPRAVRATGQDLFLWLVRRAIESGASDLHIEPGLGMARARMRVHGVLREILELPDATCRTVVGAAKAAVGLAAESFRTLDGAFSVRHRGEIWNVRVSAMPMRRDYQKLVFRFLPRTRRPLRFEDLLQPESVVRRLKHACERPQGLILVCGPTGSGKTTTLMTCLSEINRTDTNLVTIEDPVEYEIRGLNQAELDLPRKVGWSDLLTAVLRQDPDVILIGEIRDRQTAETALRASLTGHLVFATLHTLSSCKAIQRLTDLGVNADMLAESLVLLQSQRLLPRLCRRCRSLSPAEAAEISLLERHPNALARLSGTEPFRGQSGGCPSCSERGAGRIAAMEIVPVDDLFADAISRGVRALELQRIATRAGHATLFEAALALAASGEVRWEDARLEAANWEDFQ